jgi:hypothetical protein
VHLGLRRWFAVDEKASSLDLISALLSHVEIVATLLIEVRAESMLKCNSERHDDC